MKHKTKQRAIGTGFLSALAALVLGVSALNVGNVTATAANEVDISTLGTGTTVTASGENSVLTWSENYPIAELATVNDGAYKSMYDAMSSGVYAQIAQGETVSISAQDLSHVTGNAANGMHTVDSFVSFAFVPSQFMQGNTADKDDLTAFIIEAFDGTNTAKFKIHIDSARSGLVTMTYNGSSIGNNKWTNLHPLGYNQNDFASYILAGRIAYSPATSKFAVGNDVDGTSNSMTHSNPASGWNMSSVSLKMYVESYANSKTSAGVYIYSVGGKKLTANSVYEPVEIELASDVMDYYEVNKALTLPTATIGGQTATVSITDPTGKTVENGFTPYKYGEYTAKYSAVINETTYYQEYTFKVADAQVSVSGAGKVEYTAYPYLGAFDSITYDQGAEPMKEAFSKGGLFTAYKGDKIYINSATNVDNMTIEMYKTYLNNQPVYAEGETNQRLLSLAWVPSDGYGKSEGVSDFADMYIKIVNVVNSNEYVVIKVSYQGGDICYSSVYETGVKGVTGYGTQWISSYNSSLASGAATTFSLFYDRTTCQFYVGRADSVGGQGAKLLKGGGTYFYASEVNFEIWFEGYTNEEVPAQIYVNGLRGVRGADVYFDTDSNATNMEMATGAAARIVSAEDSGLRFETVVEKAKADKLAQMVEDGVYTSVEYGTLIVPELYVQNGWTTHAACEGKTLLDVASTGFKGMNANGDYFYWASIINLQAHNYYRNFVGIGYAKLTGADGSVQYVYAEASLDNARSVYTIAKAEVEVTTDAEELAILNGYINSVVNVTVDGETITNVDVNAPYSVTFDGTTYTVTTTVAIKTVVVNGTIVSATVAEDGLSATFTL